MGGKLLAVGIGFAFILLGFGFTLFGRPVIRALNRDYGRMPGRFQYPVWWHRMMSAVFVGFGVLVAVTGLITVKG